MDSDNAMMAFVAVVMCLCPIVFGAIALRNCYFAAKVLQFRRNVGLGFDSSVAKLVALFLAAIEPRA